MKRKFTILLAILAFASQGRLSAQQISIEARVVTTDGAWFVVLDVEVSDLDAVDAEVAHDIQELIVELESVRLDLDAAQRSQLLKGRQVTLRLESPGANLPTLEVDSLDLEVALPLEERQAVMRVTVAHQDVKVMHAYQPFQIELTIPRHLAAGLGETIEVSIATESGEETSIELRSRGNARGALVFSHSIEATLGRGAFDNTIGPLPLWDMKSLTVENGETVTFSAAGATCQVIAYKHANQMRVGQAMNELTEIDRVLQQLMNSHELSADAVGVLHRKQELISRARQVHGQAGLSAFVKDRLMSAFLDLVLEDPSTWTPLSDDEQVIEVLGYSATDVEEKEAIEAALRAAQGDHDAILSASVDIATEVSYDLITNLTGVNQLQIVIFGIDNRGNRVDMTHRVLAGIELGTMAIGGYLFLEARAVQSGGGLVGAGGGGIRPRPGMARGGRGRHSTLRLDPAEILGDAATEAGQLRSPRATGPLLPGRHSGPMENFGLPERPWAQDYVNDMFRRLDGPDLQASARAFDQLDYMNMNGDFLKSLPAARRARIDRAMQIIENLQDLDEYLGQINMREAWGMIVLHSASDLLPGELAARTIPFCHSQGLLNARIFARAAGIGESTAGVWLRQAAQRAGLKPENLARIHLEIPTSNLVRTGSIWRIRWSR